GKKLFEDLREREDPEAQTTINTRFPSQRLGKVDPRAVAVPDPSSVQYLDPLQVVPPSLPNPTASSSPSASAGLSLPTTSWTKGTPATVMDASNPLRAMHDALVRAGLAVPNGMSNWLGVTADRSATGHPI